MIIRDICLNDFTKEMKKYKLKHGDDFFLWYYPNPRNYYNEDDPNQRLVRVEFTSELPEQHLLLLRLKYSYIV